MGLPVRQGAVFRGRVCGEDGVGEREDERDTLVIRSTYPEELEVAPSRLCCHVNVSGAVVVLCCAQVAAVRLQQISDWLVGSTEQ